MSKPVIGGVMTQRVAELEKALLSSIKAMEDLATRPGSPAKWLAMHVALDAAKDALAKGES